MSTRTPRLAAVLGAAALTVATVLAASAPANAADSGAPGKGFVQGFDVSNAQPKPDIAGAAGDGAQFVYVKASDNDPAYSPVNQPASTFAAQWSAAGQASLLRGVYTVVGAGDGKGGGTATADAQKSADAFVAGLTAQGVKLSGADILPPALDFENGATTECWMTSDSAWSANAAAYQSKMVAWIGAYVAEIEAKTGRIPAIYTNADWWSTCTGDSRAFAQLPLWVASYGSGSAAPSAPGLPGGWSTYRFWQWRASAQSAGGFAGDQDVFHGTVAQLQSLLAPVPRSATPSIGGTPKVHNQLLAYHGSWTSGTKFTYQWLAGGAKISGATASHFRPTATQHGKKLSLAVTGTLSGYAPTTVISKVTGGVTSAKLTTKTPTISGSAKVGSRLTAYHGRWTSGTSFAYQWYQNGHRIPRATSNRYTVTASVRSATLTVKITGKKAGYASASKTSAATTVVH